MKDAARYSPRQSSSPQQLMQRRPRDATAAPSLSGASARGRSMSPTPQRPLHSSSRNNTNTNTNTTGLGLYPMSPLHHHQASSASSSSSLSSCRKSHVGVLCMGMLLGYLLLPILLMEVQLSDFLERDSEALLRSENYFLRPTSSSATLAAMTTGRSLDGAASPTRSLATDVEQRLMEDHNVLSHQSLPTATTPIVMKTNVLPDHHRKKILVTGGAGFVGSHLVDKLMMEGHEVIVVDNFFTGQKRNIAHWLHHPLFR
jgi:hypothetical protein